MLVVAYPEQQVDPDVDLPTALTFEYWIHPFSEEELADDDEQLQPDEPDDANNETQSQVEPESNQLEVITTEEEVDDFQSVLNYYSGEEGEEWQIIVVLATIVLLLLVVASIVLCVSSCQRSSSKVDPEIVNDIFNNKTGQMPIVTDDNDHMNNTSLQIEDFKDDTEPEPDIEDQDERTQDKDVEKYQDSKTVKLPAIESPNRYNFRFYD